jgi:hypothetical protein
MIMMMKMRMMNKMCDCYEAKCSGEGCNIIIPIHIADFCTPRENIKAYCKKHVTKNCMVFELSKGYKEKSFWNTLLSFPKGYKFGFEVLDTTKVENFEKNYSINPHDLYCKDGKYKIRGRKAPVVSPNIANWNWIK